LRSNSSFTFSLKALGEAKESTMTEWSMTRSTGDSGLMRCGSPPSFAIAWRIAARSTTAGTPVKSCIRTRAGRKAISRSERRVFSHSATPLMSSSVTVRPFSSRTRFSSKTFIENGSRAMSPSRAALAAASRLK
jgi:hypothetical protein